MTGPVPRTQCIGVIGAGTMGAGIAQVAASAGHPVLLYDTRADAAPAAVERIRAQLQRLVGKAALSAADASAAERRLRAVADLAEIADCALVIEAIVEDLDAKREVFAELEQLSGPDAIRATNTSTIPVTAIASELKHPERLCGMHFFNPAPLMRLVEVPSGAATDPAVAERVAATARSWGKTAVRCADTPGFIVNRVARPFYGEGQRIAEDGGHTPRSIDAAMRAAGFKMGPFELADLIGNDVNLAAAESVWEQTGHDPRYEPTESQRKLVADNRLGRKTGRGWYDYSQPLDIEPEPDEEVSTRILAMLVNEAAALVDRREAAAADVDTAMRLGTNYPRGPLEWGDEIGAQRIAEVLGALHRQHPSGRYRLSDRLAAAAKGGRSLRD